MSAASTSKPRAKRGSDPAAQPPSARRLPRRPPAKPVGPAVPRQGYEPEEEIPAGDTVHPPTGGELVESVMDLVGELAGSSLSAGGRLLKDAFSLLRRP